MLKWATFIGLALFASAAHAQEKKEPPSAPVAVGTANGPAGEIETIIETKIVTIQKESDPELKFRQLRTTRVEIARALEDTRIQRVAIQDEIGRQQATRKPIAEYISIAPSNLSEQEIDIELASARDRLQRAEEDLKNTPPGTTDFDKKREFVEIRKKDVSQGETYKARARAQQEERTKAAQARADAIGAIDKKIESLRLQDALLAKALVKLGTSQITVDDEISGLLKTESQRNDFKKQIALAFTFLVLLVIVGFFAVSWRDSTVRQAIFSSDSGIQFLTLFSVVIAIILFGITGILESKELAALLGGLSGYILGRVTSQSNIPAVAPATPGSSRSPGASASSSTPLAHP
jgi:hypothetical protein